jgi:GNAT superfamily N-acetyltransferase
MTYSIEKVSESTKADAIRFLLRYEDLVIFLLGNLEAYGANLTEEANSGNFQLIRDGDRIIGVFCLTRRGNLLIQSEVGEPVFEIVLRSCQEEQIPIKGLLGEWEYCLRFWNFLKVNRVIQKEAHASKEILYSADLASYHGEPQEGARFLEAGDYKEWRRLNSDYLKESELPDDLGEEQTRAQFLWKAERKIVWGRFTEGCLASVAELNAKALDLGQVGGVYTVPQFRKRGLAKSLMRQLMLDAKKVHGIRKLIIFTGDENMPARKVYESLGVKPAAYFALLFGE